MSQPAPARMSPDDFSSWGERQQDRYELVDGVPVRMMSGASRRHDRIVLNILVASGTRLRGSPCGGFTAGTSVATPGDRRRRPDAGIECGPRRDGDYVANEPRVVFEVLSPSTRDFDLYGKLDEYRGVASLREIVVVDPDMPQAHLWSRTGDGEWQGRPIEGLDAEVALGSVGIALPLREIYDTVEFRPRPQLVPE